MDLGVVVVVAANNDGVVVIIVLLHIRVAADIMVIVLGGTTIILGRPAEAPLRKIWILRRCDGTSTRGSSRSRLGGRCGCPKLEETGCLVGKKKDARDTRIIQIDWYISNFSDQ